MALMWMTLLGTTQIIFVAGAVGGDMVRKISIDPSGRPENALPRAKNGQMHGNKVVRKKAINGGALSEEPPTPAQGGIDGTPIVHRIAIDAAANPEHFLQHVQEHTIAGTVAAVGPREEVLTRSRDDKLGGKIIVRKTAIATDALLQATHVDAGKRGVSHIFQVKAVFPVRDSDGSLLEKANFEKADLLAEATTAKWWSFAVEVTNESGAEVVGADGEHLINGAIGSLEDGGEVELVESDLDNIDGFVAIPSGSYLCNGQMPDEAQVMSTNCISPTDSKGFAQIDAQLDGVLESNGSSLPFYPSEVIHASLRDDYDDNQHDLVAAQIAHATRQSDPMSLTLVDGRVLKKVLSLLQNDGAHRRVVSSWSFGKNFWKVWRRWR